MIKVAQSDILNNFQIYIWKNDFINSHINHSKRNKQNKLNLYFKSRQKMLQKDGLYGIIREKMRKELIINSQLQDKMKKKESKQYKPNSNKSGSSSTRLPAINQKRPPIQSNTLNINISSYQDEGLITLIQQYLLKNNLFDTLETFQRDCLKGFKQSIKSIDSLKKELLESFDSGNRDVFEVRFRQFVPLSMRTKDTKTLRMEFYLELYFFIYAIHPYLGKKKIIDSTSKQHFISFLEGRGALLCKQQEFLPFYALAYVPKPQEHQTFKSIFTKNWITNLKKEFNLFLDKLYPNTKTPLLVNIYDKFIQMNLQLEKYSSAALTEPDQELENNMMIQQQIEQNLQQSIIHDPQPVLLQNNNSNKIINNSIKIANNSTKILNNSLDKIQKPPKQLQNLSNSLNNKSPELQKQKQLEQLIQLRQRANQFEEQRNGLVSLIETMKKKYQSLQNDFKENFQSVKFILQDSQNKWFRLIQEIYNVALDVYNAAITLSDGMPLSDPQILAKKGEKLQKYKRFMSMNMEDLLSDNVIDYSFFDRPENDISMDMAKKNNEYVEREGALIEIDFDKIKAVLSKIPDEQMSQSDIAELQFEKCLILQALRWRMTKVRGAPLKREVVLSYTIFDVLQISISNEKGDRSIINLLLNSRNQTLLHQTTLFIYALGMDYYGRQYLYNNQLMIALMRLRKMPNVNQLIKGIVIVIFQMLSNKRACQVVMIENGLIEEIVQALDQERDQMAPFIMQYTTALLLNLLLNKMGLDRAQSIRSQILMALINLMQIQHPSVKSFIHASLYPLLSRKVFRQKALQFGMEENIKYLLQNNPSLEVEHQLGYVYNRLLMEEDVEEEKQDDPDYDQINDEEIGEDAQLVNQEISSPLSGQHLLIKKYALIGPSAMEQTMRLKEQAKDTFSKAIYYDRDQYERYSVQTPLLGKAGRKSQIILDKGYTHNNSVYSSKSSNRVLLSEKNSRIKNISHHLQKSKVQTISQKPKTQPPKQHRQHSKQQARNVNKLPDLSDMSYDEPVAMGKKQNRIEVQREQETFRRMEHEDSPLKGPSLNELNEQEIPINQNAKIVNPVDLQRNQSQAERLNKLNEEQTNLRNRKLKPYQKTDEYQNAFQARSQLVRTPPQKPS